MTFTNFIAIIRARWWLVLLVLLLTSATTLAVSLFLPKKYVAVASVVIDAKPDPISAIIYPGMASPAFMATQVDVVNSERVALRAVRNLKLAEAPAIREQWQADTQGAGTIEQWTAAFLQKGMDVRPSKESNVLSVVFSGQDPRFAAAVANAFVQAYIEVSLELRVDPARQYNTYFDTRAKAAREALEAAQAKLSAFQRESGIVANDERLDVETARLSELSSQVVGLQGLSAESSSRQTQADGASSDRLQDVLNNPVIVQLKSDLNRAEARQQELGARYGDSHPQMLEARANITELRSRIDAETKRVVGGVTVSNSINRQRESQVRAALEAQRAKVLRMKAVRDDAAVLTRDVESAQRSFESITARFNQSSLESQNTQGNINVLTQATAPVEPASPRVALNTVLSAVAGLVLGLGLALLLELRDLRVRAASDLVAVLQLPLLGILPKPDAKGGASGRLSGMEQRLLGHQAAAGKGAA